MKIVLLKNDDLCDRDLREQARQVMNVPLKMSFFILKMIKFVFKSRLMQHRAVGGGA